jgi:hypothetical protein
VSRDLSAGGAQRGMRGTSASNIIITSIMITTMITTIAPTHIEPFKKTRIDIITTTALPQTSSTLRHHATTPTGPTVHAQPPTWPYLNKRFLPNTASAERHPWSTNKPLLWFLRWFDRTPHRRARCMMMERVLLGRP